MYVYSFQNSQLEPLNQKQQNMMPKKNSINPTDLPWSKTFSAPPSVQRIQGSRNQEEVQRDQRCRKPGFFHVPIRLLPPNLTQPTQPNQFKKLWDGIFCLVSHGLVVAKCNQRNQPTCGKVIGCPFLGCTSGYMCGKQIQDKRKNPHFFVGGKNE